MAAVWLLEREEDLAALTRRLAAVRDAGQGGALLIEGPAGIGKSTLLAAALEAADGVTVLRARGTELEAGLAFGGVRQLFARALRALPADERDRLLAGPAGLAGAVLGAPRSEPPGETPPDDLSDPLYGLYWLAADLAEQAPLVLAVDDLHWLDEESARFVAYLAARWDGLPLLLLATARPNEPGAVSATVEAYADVADVLRPRPLTAAAVAEIIPGRPAEAVLAATGGNPLLVTEVARAGADVGLDDIRLTSVARSVLSRVERVSSDAMALTRAVALFGAGASLRDAADVAGLDLPTAAAAADALIAAAVLDEGELLTFVHPMMRSAVYDDLGVHARRSGHARAAVTLRARNAPAEEIAAHVLAGEPADDQANVAVLREAASAAMSAVAPRAAARYLERALDEPVAPGPERTALLRELGRLQAMLGRPEAAATLAAALEGTDDAVEAVDVALDLSKAHFRSGDIARAVEVLQPFVGHAQLDPERLLTVDVNLAATLASWQANLETFKAAVARFPEDLSGDTPAQRTALLWKGLDALAAGRPFQELRDLVRRAVTTDRGLFIDFVGDQEPLTLLITCGEFDLAEQLIEAQVARSRVTGDEAGYAAGQAWLGASLQMRGFWRQAEAELTEALNHPAQTPDVQLACYLSLSEVLVVLGRLTDAEEMLDRASRSSGRQSVLMSRVRRAQIENARGNYADYDAYKECAGALADDAASSPITTRWLCPYAVGLDRMGQPDEAVAVMEDYLAQARAVGESASIGEAELTLGMLKRGDAAMAHLERAHATLEPSPHRWLAGRATLELGAALRRSGGHDRARTLLRSALDYAERHGAVEIARRAREELHLMGARVRNVYVTGYESLTPAEQRVARLAADGLTNREIGQHLFLTRKTVEMHMSRCLRKLDVASRIELAAVLEPAVAREAVDAAR